MGQMVPYPLPPSAARSRRNQSFPTRLRRV